jgi:uncharacterized protein YwqG
MKINKFMKKSLGFLITFLFIYNLSLSLASAQEISLTPTPTPAVLEYQLPYPGILPGHPFYFFKNFRDKLWGLLISNPLKKAEFDLLQADKNLQAAVYLAEQNKESKVIFEALQKSEDYFASAIANAKEAKKQGIYTVDFSAKITIANLKYQEVVLGLSKSAKGDDKKKFEVELKNLKNLGKKAQALNPK